MRDVDDRVDCLTVEAGAPMSDRTRDADKASRSTTILDPLRPAVVVRRRVYDAALSRAEESEQKVFTTASQSSPSAVEDDENGPPSSINVARALASLRADELQRVEELLRADEEDEAEDDEPVEESVEESHETETGDEAAPRAPAVPTILLGKATSLSDLAQKMGVPANELPATLVARGYYALTSKTMLPRETARVIAEMFGFRVEAAPEHEEQAPAKSGSRIATKGKAKAKVAARAKASAKAKTTRRRAAR